MTAPLWLAEEPWLLELLAWFLDKLELPRTQGVTRRVTKASVPALYQFTADTRYRWQLIERLDKQHGIFIIRYENRLNRSQERYENAQLRLNPASEAVLRTWLDRPLVDPVTEAWRRALFTHAEHFQDKGAALLIAQPGMPGHTPLELVAAFATISGLLEQKLSLREISARCFRGNSKFLDQRHELLLCLFGERATFIQARPLLLTAWAPSESNQLLIVENQDSFLRLVEDPPPGYALLYSGGFRASAGRLSSSHTRFAFLPDSDTQRFQYLWRNVQFPAFFWGDLDFTGLSILKTLRHTLPQLQAWRPGYNPMLEELRNGGGHRPEEAGKIRQIDPVETGCIYSDLRLLPELRERQRFLDQEAIRVRPSDATAHRE